MKRETGNILVSLLVIMTLIFTPAAMLFAQADQPVTQGDFAVYIVRALGLEHNLQVGALQRDYIELLERNGIVPPGGFKPDEPLTQKDMAFMMVRATGLENRVLNKMTGQSLVQEEKAVIKLIEGDVKHKRDPQAEYADAVVGDELFISNSIKTGPSSMVELMVGKFSAIQLGENTEITIEELSTRGANAKENVRIFLKQGEMLVNVVPDTNKVNFESHTKTTVAGVMGTVYGMGSTPNQDTTNCLKGTITTFTINGTGAPASDPKPLDEGQQMISDPTGQQDPKYGSISPELWEDMLKRAARLLEYLKNAETQGTGESLGQKTGDDMSPFEARQSFAEGSDLALAAALEVLSEEGIEIETTGPAAAANTTITKTQLTQFINDLLLFETFNEYNVDTTPIGQ
ncbi:MAG: FecR family protein [Candidatus Auribacterota bacterium]